MNGRFIHPPSFSSEPDQNGHSMSKGNGVGLEMKSSNGHSSPITSSDNSTTGDGDKKPTGEGDEDIGPMVSIMQVVRNENTIL